MANKDENVSLEILYLHHLKFFSLEEHFDAEISSYRWF